MTVRSRFLAFFLLLSLQFFWSSCVTNNAHGPLYFETIHGPLKVDDPLAVALIEHPQFQRMKGIEQHGLNSRALGEPSFTRFEHSVGVYALLKKHGASRAEQIAGLLHDVSHTAFSHVGDQFFGHEDGKSAWQDDHHGEFLKAAGFVALAEEHGLSLQDLDPKQAAYKRLEQDLPTLCADRINYILHGAMILRLISSERLKEIDDSLYFDEKKGVWYFNDVRAAEDFSEASVWMTANSWGSPASFAVTKWFVDALRLGIEKKIIGEKDFRWGTDAVVWGRLARSGDPKILELLKKVENPSKHFSFKMASAHPCREGEVHQKFKIRAVNPFVCVSKEKNLSLLSSETTHYDTILKEIRAERGKGYCLAYF